MLGSHMEAEIREQPAGLAANADRYLEELSTSLGGRSFDSVVLAARGSSDHAALYARYLIEVHLGIPAVLAAPSVWTRFGRSVRYSNTLVVGISQSGAAPDVSEVVAALRGEGHASLGITNAEGSLLELSSETSLRLGIGPEQSIAATKTYTATLLALYQLVRALGADLPAPLLPDARWVDTCEAAAFDASGTVVRSSPIFGLGRGFSFASAVEAGLKLMECALIPCQAYSTADFQHGPMAMARHGSAAVAFGDVGSVGAGGCEVVHAPQPEVSAELAPLWEIIFAQWLALLAGRARGLNPDHVQGIQKVTRTL